MFAITDQAFFGLGTHQNFFSHFSDINKDLNHIHLHQISLDGPNVNIKFHQEFSAHLKKRNFHSLIDIGSCSLHIIHRSFTTGAVKCGWKLQKVLKGAYHILHNTLPRREDYESGLNLDYFIVTMTDSKRRSND